MNSINEYLKQHFLRSERLAETSGMSESELFRWVVDGLIPGPSYTVDTPSRISSFVFGEMAADGAVVGRYFNPATLTWIQKTRQFMQQFNSGEIQAALRADFRKNFQEALAELNQTTWRLRDCFDDSGVLIEEGFETRFENVWVHFLKGTECLCVSNPTSERIIAIKEILQEKLTALTDNGSKPSYSDDEKAEVVLLIGQYRKAAMPFSPVEYPISSRKRIADDVMKKLGIE